MTALNMFLGKDKCVDLLSFYFWYLLLKTSIFCKNYIAILKSSKFNRYISDFD